jgi:uncharacterized protein with GYD domain
MRRTGSGRRAQPSSDEARDGVSRARESRNPSADDVGCYAGAAGVAADSSSRSAFGVLPGCLSDTPGPNLLHDRILAASTATALYIRPMPHYITLMRWTTQGYAGLPKWRERLEEGERIIADAGGSLVGVYVTLGRYDVVEVFEAPDDDVAIEILMKLNQYGAEHTETLRAFTRDEAEEIIKKL